MSEHENLVSTATAVMVRKPKEILADAARAALALTEWMKNKRKPVIFNDEQYPEFEDWQLCGSFYNLTAKVAWTRPVTFGDVMGFEAGADLIDRITGQVISSAEAMCLNDEEKWSKRTKYEWVYVLKDGSKRAEDPGKDNIVWEDNPNKPGSKRPRKEKVATGEVAVPLFQLRSMAQTRACAKALRNVLSWVFVLAGFKPNIAEELTGDEFQQRTEDGYEKRNPKADVAPPKRKSEAAPPPDAPPAQESAPAQQPPTGNAVHDPRTYKDRLYEATGGDVKELKRLTTFVGKDGETVNGKSKWEWVSEAGAKVAYYRLEDEQKQGADKEQREPGQD